MRELGVQAANGTYSGADRVALNEEIGELIVYLRQLNLILQNY